MIHELKVKLQYGEKLYGDVSIETNAHSRVTFEINEASGQMVVGERCAVLHPKGDLCVPLGRILIAAEHSRGSRDIKFLFWARHWLNT